MDLIRTFLRDVKPGDTILDVGSNQGWYTSLFREECPEAIIHAFEPFLEMYRRCLRKHHLDPKIHCWNLGVGAVCEVVEGVAIHEAWTINKPGETDKGRNRSHGGELFDMRVTTIDAFLLGWPEPVQVSALKVDTDGYDFRVLQGAILTIQRWKPRILIEFGYCVVDLDGPDAVDDMLNWIHGMGYAIYNERGERCAVDHSDQWYPYTTTADFLLVPNGQELNPA